MIIPFRQGIIYKRNNKILTFVNDNTVLATFNNENPFIFTITNNKDNVIKWIDITRTFKWNISNTTKTLFLELDDNGELIEFSTSVEYKQSTSYGSKFPQTPSQNQYFFNNKSMQSFLYIKNRWQLRNLLYIGSINGRSIEDAPIGSHVGTFGNVLGSRVIFDSENNVIKKPYDSKLLLETDVISNSLIEYAIDSSQINNFMIEKSDITVPKFTVVGISDSRICKLEKTRIPIGLTLYDTQRSEYAILCAEGDIYGVDISLNTGSVFCDLNGLLYNSPSNTAINSGYYNKIGTYNKSEQLLSLQFTKMEIIQ